MECTERWWDEWVVAYTFYNIFDIFECCLGLLECLKWNKNIEKINQEEHIKKDDIIFIAIG